MKYSALVVAEFLYVYVMSLFPNWNIEEHYLERFKHKIKEYEDEFNDVPAAEDRDEEEFNQTKEVAPNPVQ